MLAALNIGAVLLGVATGGLVASIGGILLGGILTLLGVDAGPDIGLVIAVVSGLATGGYIAGARAKHSSRFHGAVTGLVLAFVVMLIAVFGGSPASTMSIIWLAILSTVIAGLGGWLAGQRRSRS